MFIKLHPNPIVGAWRLPEQTLHEQAIKATRIRKHFDEKVESQKQEEKPLDNESEQLDDWKVVHSTKNHNPDGLREKDLRARDRDAACIGRKYKKRNLSELSSDDVA